jgi:hypothetical protein
MADRRVRRKLKAAHHWDALKSIPCETDPSIFDDIPDPAHRGSEANPHTIARNFSQVSWIKERIVQRKFRCSNCELRESAAMPHACGKHESVGTEIRNLRSNPAREG